MNTLKKKQMSIKIKDLVLLYVDSVDRGKSAPKNLLCYVVEQKHDTFKLCSLSNYTSFVIFVVNQTESLGSLTPWTCKWKIYDTAANLRGLRTNAR